MSPTETLCAINAYERRTKDKFEFDALLHYNILYVLRFLTAEIYNSNRRPGQRRTPERLMKLPFSKLFKKKSSEQKPKPRRTADDYLKILSARKN